MTDTAATDSASQLALQMVIVGVGGQGVLFATRILERAALGRGLPAIGSETHGMSQRGGSVASHLKVGPFDGPLIARGSADVLVGINWEETLRGLPYLRPGGVCFANRPADQTTPEPVAKALAELDITLVAVDATAAAKATNNARATNVALLGAVGAHPLAPFTLDELRDAIEKSSPPPFVKANLATLDAGAALVGSS